MDTNTKKIIDFFKSLDWPLLEISEDVPKVSIENEVLYEQPKKGTHKIRFYKYNQRERRAEKRYFYLDSILFDNKTDFSNLVYISSNAYKISYYNQLNSILQASQRKIKNIEILKEYKIIQVKENEEIKISPEIFTQILEEAKSIYNKARSYSNSVENYLTNNAIRRFNIKDIGFTTSTEQGEFEFIIDRFNLQTKKTKKDFTDHLNSKDIERLEIFVDNLIKKEVFSDLFLKKLDEYFIKEKLEDILRIGRKILLLKSDDISTKTAKEVISCFHDKKIKQMESVWQKFFEKYLLYLIFSYKEIKPKVKLTGISTSKKFPDFIGINHYEGVDIIEIKTHLKHAVVWDNNHKNFAFSSEMSKAIIQTMNYMDAVTQNKFKDPSIKSELEGKLSNTYNLHNPRGIIIISSAVSLAKGVSKFDQKKKDALTRDFTKLRNSLHNIEIITFDEVLSVAQNYSENILKEFIK